MKAPSHSQFEFIHGVVRTARIVQGLEKKDFLEWFAVAWDAQEKLERNADNSRAEHGDV